jgi:predicted peptidase
MLRVEVLLQRFITCTLLVLLSAFTARASQTNSIPKGQVVEKVESLTDSSQTYALFLPSNYSPDRKWPVLFAFDPGAHGRVPVERFKDAAEK